MHCVLFLFRTSIRCCITLLFPLYINRHNIFTGFKPLIACESPYFTAQQTPSNYPQRLQCAALEGKVGFFENCVKLNFV